MEIDKATKTQLRASFLKAKQENNEFKKEWESSPERKRNPAKSMILKSDVKEFNLPGKDQCSDEEAMKYVPPTEEQQRHATYIKGLEQFEDRETFENLTKRTYINTKWDVISAIISYDSMVTVAICRQDDDRFAIRAYNLRDKTHK